MIHAAITYRIALGPHAGQKAFTLKTPQSSTATQHAQRPRYGGVCASAANRLVCARIRHWGVAFLALEEFTSTDLAVHADRRGVNSIRSPVVAV